MIRSVSVCVVFICCFRKIPHAARGGWIREGQDEPESHEPAIFHVGENHCRSARGKEG